MKVYLDDFQVTNCQVPESAKTMLPLQWGDLTSCLALKRSDIPPTNKLSRKKFRQMMHTYYIGKILPTSFQLVNHQHTHIAPTIIRSGEEWLVEAEGFPPMLSASVGDDPTIPPITGWHFYNFDTEEDEEDPSVTCSILSNHSSCTLTVTLTGLAKEFQPECEGEYEDTGLKSSGRQVAEARFMIFNPMPLQPLSGVQSETPIGPLPFR